MSDAAGPGFPGLIGSAALHGGSCRLASFPLCRYRQHIIAFHEDRIAVRYEVLPIPCHKQDEGICPYILQALAEAVDLNIIAVDQESKAGVYTVNVPKYADSTEEQRRNRVMPDITWEALLSGAIHQVKTKGVLRVSL